ncbi:MAG: MATE family efflux transporter [Oscillospiraceae bacterium]|nr:MATE family efflux transporter [Oscillospiraceae bacterium]
MMNSRSLTEGAPWKGILSFMMPVLLGLLLQQLYNTVDTIIVGNFAGESQLAAVGACGVLTMAFLAMANGFSAGACILIAQLFGAERKEDMRRQASSSLIVMIAMGVAATVVALFISRFALRTILATPESLIPMANLYFKIYAAGLIFQFGYNIVSAILRGIGDSKATLYFLLVASVINVVLDIVFVYSLDMGVAGAAIATDIAQALSCIVGFVYMMKKYPVFRWKFKEFTFERELGKRSLKAGFPMALQQFIVSFGFVFIQRAVNSYGEAMTASFSVAQKIETYMTLPASALMTTQGTFTGQNIGAGRIDRVKTGAKHTVLISEIITAGILIVAFIFARPIVTAFGLGTEAVGYCTDHVRFVAVSLPVFAAYFPLLGLFQGANNALFSTLVATGALTVRVAVTYLLQGMPGFGYHMIWWNTLFGWGFGFVLAWTHFLWGKWQKGIESKKIILTQRRQRQ